MPLSSFLVSIFLVVAVLGCTPEPKLSVVVSMRRSVASPVLRSFARETGADIEVSYVEPDAPLPDDFDVLWSSNPAPVFALASAAKLSRLSDAALATRPGEWRDPNGFWVAVSADIRVIAYDPERVDESAVPTRFEELLNPTWAKQLTFASPENFRSAWHAAALFASRGAEPASAFFRDLVSGGAVIASSDREVLASVGGKGPPIGVLDGEIAFTGRAIGRRIGVLIPDQDSFGAVVRAATLSISSRAAQSDRAHQLVEYLLSSSVGRRLTMMSSHIALFEDQSAATSSIAIGDIRTAALGQTEIADQLSAVRRSLATLR